VRKEAAGRKHADVEKDKKPLSRDKKGAYSGTMSAFLIAASLSTVKMKGTI